MLGQDARRLRVDGDVHAHVRHDAEEAQEHDAVGEQQLEAAADGSGAGVRRGLLDLVEREQHVAEDADDEVDHEQYPPHADLLAVSVGVGEGGDAVRAPHGDPRGEQGGERLDELAEGQRGGELITLDEHGQQRVERHLHQCVADAEEREGDDDEHQLHGGLHRAQQVGDDRQRHGDERHQDGPQHGLAPPDLVHQDAGGHGEDQEPEEHHGGEQVGGSVGETELGLHVVRRGADQVDEAHDEEGEHDRQDLGESRVDWLGGFVAHCDVSLFSDNEL